MLFGHTDKFFSKAGHFYFKQLFTCIGQDEFLEVCNFKQIPKKFFFVFPLNVSLTEKELIK